MNKLAKGFLIAFAAMMLCIVLVVFCINLYVESEGVQIRLENALSSSLHVPVKLTQVHFTLWGGLKLIGFSIPAESAGTNDQPDFVNSPAITARIFWKPLFSRRLIIRELLISQPTVVWTQSAAGSWILPGARHARLSAEAESVENASATPIPPLAANKPVAPPSHTRGTNEFPGNKKLQFKIAAARIENATFHFLDRKGQPLADLEGVTVNCPTAAVGEAHGAATITKATFHGSVVVENISTPFTFSNGRLLLPQIDARIYGGSLQGAYSVEPAQESSPFTLDLLFDGVNLNRLLADATAAGSGQKITGTLQGSLDVYGQHGRKNSAGGSGQITLRSGHMEQYSLLQMIGEALQIDELIHLDLRQAQSNLRFGEGKAFIDTLVMESPNLNICATGTTGLDGRQLDLAARMTVDPNIIRRLPGWVQSNFQPIVDSDRKLIFFKIGGSLQHPDTDLARNVVGQKYAKEVMDVYRLLTGGNRRKKKPDKSRKPEEIAMPSATPASIPAVSPASSTAPSPAQEQPTHPPATPLVSGSSTPMPVHPSTSPQP